MTQGLLEKPAWLVLTWAEHGSRVGLTSCTCTVLDAQEGHGMSRLNRMVPRASVQMKRLKKPCPSGVTLGELQRRPSKDSPLSPETAALTRRVGRVV